MNQLEVIAFRSLLIVLAGLLATFLFRRKAASTTHLFYAGILFSLVLLPILKQWIPQNVLQVESLPAPIQIVASRMESVPNGTFGILETNVAPSASPWTLTFASFALCVWATGCFGLLFRLAWQLISLSKVIKSSELLGTAEAEAFDIPGIKACEIRVSSSISVPSTAWMGRNVILLPTTYQNWPVERTRSVVLHEVAHITRYDWCVQLVGRVACALYWPNPLVWLVLRKTTDLAEQAADDLVLSAGVKPSHYAEDLLHIAKTVRGTGTALTTSMALKSDVGRRIEMVLNHEKKRGTVRVGGLILAGLGIATATVPAASLLLTHKHADPSSRFADIHNGTSTSATPANRFVGTLGDGRTLDLIQIGSRQSDSTYRAWRPDGSVIATNDRLPVTLPSKSFWAYSVYQGYDKETTTAFVFRLKGSGNEAPFVGITSGPGAGDEEGIYIGGWTLPADKNGDELAVCLMKTPSGNAPDTKGLTFYIADGAPQTAVSYDLTTGKAVDHNVYSANATFQQDTTAQVYLPGIGEAPFKDESGNPMRREVPAIVVSYDDIQAPASLALDVVGITSTGKEVRSLGLRAHREGGVRHLTAWLPKNKGITRVEIVARILRAAEIIDVHTKPRN